MNASVIFISILIRALMLGLSGCHRNKRQRLNPNWADLVALGRRWRKPNQFKVKKRCRFGQIWCICPFPHEHILDKAMTKAVTQRLLLLAVALAAGSLSPRPALFAQADFQGASHLMPFDEDTIRYSKTKDNSPIARLQERLDRGEARLQHDDRFGYLLSVLRELRMSTNSQLLVFSKTSFQRERIAPKSPRAVFFNDDIYLGYVPGSPLLEVS